MKLFMTKMRAFTLHQNVSAFTQYTVNVFRLIYFPEIVDLSYFCTQQHPRFISCREYFHDCNIAFHDSAMVRQNLPFYFPLRRRSSGRRRRQEFSKAAPRSSIRRIHTAIAKPNFLILA